MKTTSIRGSSGEGVLLLLLLIATRNNVRLGMQQVQQFNQLVGLFGRCNQLTYINGYI